MSAPVMEGHQPASAVQLGPYTLMPARQIDVERYGFHESMWALPGQYKPPPGGLMINDFGKGRYRTRFVNYRWLVLRAKECGFKVAKMDSQAWR